MGRAGDCERSERQCWRQVGEACKTRGEFNIAFWSLGATFLPLIPDVLKFVGPMPTVPRGDLPHLFHLFRCPVVKEIVAG